jgi:hypothetical protein
MYAWQRIWDVTPLAAAGPRHDGGGHAADGNGHAQHDWQRVDNNNLASVQSLFHQIVPPLLQPVERQPKQPTGFICNEGLRVHVGVNTGMVGIVLSPLIHPEATDVSSKLAALISNLPNRGGRPVYVCVRSYQAWLEPVLEDLGALAGERQAIMVKHLARLVKDEQAVLAKQPATVSVQPSHMSRAEQKK